MELENSSKELIAVCVMCSTHFDNLNGEKKPTLLDFEVNFEDEGGTKGESYRKVFGDKEIGDSVQLFCKLLTAAVDKEAKEVVNVRLKLSKLNGDGDDKGNGLSWMRRLCNECLLKLKELQKVQLIIEKSQARLLNIYEDLKSTVIKAEDGNDFEDNFHEEDVEWNEGTPLSSPPDNLKSELDSKSDAGASDTGAIIREAVAVKKRKSKRLKLKKEKESEIVGLSGEPEVKWNLKECRIVLSKLNKNEIQKKQLLSSRKPGIVENSTNKVFYLISNDILLYQCTPIKFCLNKSFSCLEYQCQFIIEGPTDSFAFQKVKEHISHYHRSEYDCQKSRSCPVCEDSFQGAGLRLRCHMLKDHLTPEKAEKRVVCEICWRPVHYTAHLSHLWLHKSEEEKNGCVSRGEGVPHKIKDRPGHIQKAKKKRAALRKAKETGLERRKYEYSPDSADEEGKLAEGLPTFVRRRLKTGERFYLVKDNLLWHKGIFIRFSATEFQCQVESCGRRIEGSDYFAFEEFRKHVEAAHKKYLRKNEKNVEKMGCPLCEFKAWKPMSMKKHIFVSHWAIPAVCKSCWKPFGGGKALRDHSWTHKSEEEKAAAEIMKDQVKGPFEDPAGKPEYLRNEGILNCEFCPKEFFSKKNLRVHLKTHLPKGERRQYECPECGDKLLSKVGLTKHIERIHKKETAPKLECHICSAKFYWKDDYRFKVHMRGHTGETPWICEVCGRGFNCKVTYQRHLMTHGAIEEWFQCEFCEKRYVQRQSLRHHQKVTHGKMKMGIEETSKLLKAENREGFIGPKIAFPCGECEKIFEIKSVMEKHRVKMHKAVAVAVVQKRRRQGGNIKV